MKKILKIAAIVLCVVIAISVIYVIVISELRKYPIAPVKITDKPVKITMGIKNIANYKQFESDVTMMEHNGKLYFYRRRALNEMFPFDKYSEYLCVFEKGTARKIKDLSEERILFMIDGFVYYTRNNAVYCFNVETESEDHLCGERYTYASDAIFCSEDGTVFFPEDQEFSKYKDVHGDKTGGINKTREEYILESGTYCVEGHFLGSQDVVVYDQTGERRVLDVPYGKKSLIPCENGLLVHNEGQGDLLYLIEGDSGKLTELFTCECMVSVSAVNVYETQAFLSFKRYEKHGEFGMLRFENDTLEGTYRIDLESGQYEKVSDKIYNGLYIFDDTGIYACDDSSNIYKPDYDGNVIDTLIE